MAVRYKDIADTLQPLQTAEALTAFYYAAPKGCRDVLAGMLTEDLYRIAYAHPQTAGFTIAGTLHALSAAQELSIPNRQKALLKLAAYYLNGLKTADPALRYLASAWSLTGGQLNDTIGRSYYALRAQAMVQKARLQEAADYYLKAIALCERTKDSAGLAANYGNYAGVFSKMGDHVKAKKLKQWVARYFENSQDKRMLLIGYIGIGYECSKLDQNDSALDYYFKARQLLANGVQDANNAFQLPVNIAGIYMGKNRFDSARFFFDEARLALRKLKKLNAEKLFLMASTPAYAGVRNVEKEMALIMRYIAEYAAAQDLNRVKDGYYCLYYTYNVQGRHREALDYHLRYDSVAAMLSSEQNRQYIADTEAKYETQKKELRIAVQQKTIAYAHTLNLLLLILLALLAASVGFVLNRIRLKEARQQEQFTRQLLLNTEQERSRIARDLHDSVGQELLILKQEIQAGPGNHTAHVGSILNDIRSIARNLHPATLDKAGLQAAIEYMCGQIMESRQLFITTDISYERSLEKHTELQLFRMIQEALNNIIRHAHALAARIRLYEQGSHIIASIEDNGQGFDVEIVLGGNSTFGLLSIIERGKALRGNTHIVSGTAGTTITIEIPKHR